MRRNDARVTVYKMLRYIHDARMKGKPVTLAGLDEVAGNPDRRFLAGVLNDLLRHDYISGVAVRRYYDGLEIDVSDADVNIDGCAYMNGSGAMAAAARFLGTAFEAALETVLSL